MAEVQVLQPRAVPLGGLRSLDVRRTIPHRDRSFVGAWCFADLYGPQPVQDATRQGMDVPPHPHTGLQTVSWLFDGVIEHRDSSGVHALIRPGEVNLMTSGNGITHSEVSTWQTSVLHGVQLWVALPQAALQVPRGLEHHAPPEVPLAGGTGTALVFIGELTGVDTSPVVTHTPLLGADIRLPPGAVVNLAVDPGFEHAVLVVEGSVSFQGQPLDPDELGCLDAGPDTLTLRAGDRWTRLILLGGQPFAEEIIMWWNFIGRTHEDIVRAREEYEAGSQRFGTVRGYTGEVDRIPAPPIPPVRLRPRNRRGRMNAEVPDSASYRLLPSVSGPIYPQ